MKKITALFSSIIIATLFAAGSAQSATLSVSARVVNKVAGTMLSQNSMVSGEPGAITDATLVSQVKTKISADRMVRKLTVEVTANDGNVELAGLADSNLQAERLVTLAQSVVGVKDVETVNLKVKNSKEPLIDSYITAKVKGILVRNNILSLTAPSAIKVETKNGVVFLSGRVNDQAQKEQTIELAKSIDGVKEVKESLRIKT